MEDTLRDMAKAKKAAPAVLILVLMEDTLRAHSLQSSRFGSLVLILVLMEDTLRDRKN